MFLLQKNEAHICDKPLVSGIKNSWKYEKDLILLK